MEVPILTTLEFNTPPAPSQPREKPTLVEAIQPAVVKPYPRLEAPEPSLLKQNHGIHSQRQHNDSFCHQSLRYLLAQHILNKQKAMHVYNAMLKKETIDQLIYCDQGKPGSKV